MPEASDGWALPFGNHVLDLAGLFDDEVFARSTLNGFLALGPDSWRQTRERIGALLTGSGITTSSPATCSTWAT